MSRNGPAWDHRLVWIVLAAFGARLGVAVAAPAPLLERPWEYEEVALNLLNGTGFVATYRSTSYQALVHPFYPGVCAAIYWLVGGSSLLAVQIVQSIAVVPAAWMAFRIAGLLAGPTAGVLSAAGVALHPALMLYSLRRHALWFDAVILLTTLWLVVEAHRTPKRSRFVALGAAFGVGMLSRSSIVAFMLLACGWLLWRAADRRAALRHLALVIVVAGAIASPWLVRNALLFERPSGMLSTTGYGLWLGNNADTTGSTLAADGQPLDDPVIAAAIDGRPETEQQDAYARAAIAYIRDHPIETVRNYLLKLRNFWFWSPHTGMAYPRAFLLPYQLFYITLLAVACVGVLRLARAGYGASALLIGLFVASVGLLQSIFFVEGRHRWEIESGLVILAACAMGRLRPAASETASRSDVERVHARSILENAEEIWAWSTPAGRVRSARRAGLIQTEARLAPGVRGLELGAGTGVFTEQFAASGAFLVATDLAAEFLEKLRERTRGRTVAILAADAERLPFGDASFDVVLGSSVLHHLNVPAALDECRRVLKPNGRVVFAEPNMLNPQVFLTKNVGWLKRRAGDVPHETAFVRGALARRLQRHGFIVERITPHDFVHPGLPRACVKGTVVLGRWLERVWPVREIAGSLLVVARKA